MSKVLDQKFELVSVDRLHLAEPNPRKGNVPRIAESIKSNGFYKPLIVQRSTGRILVGNHSYIAAINEGLKELPAIWLDCTDAEGDRIMLADNLLSDAAEWDEAALAESIKAILAEGTALPDIGFDAAAYDELLASIEAANPPPVVEDEAPQIDRAAELQKKWNTARGQVWEIPSLTVKGKSHRLMCGDSTDVADVERLMDGQKADMVFTDPPYGISAVKGGCTGNAGGKLPFGGRKGRVHGLSAGAFKKSGRVHGLAKKAIIATNLYAPIIGDESTQTAISAYMICAEMEIPSLIFWGGNYYANALPPSRCWIAWDKVITGSFADMELAWTNIDHVSRLFRHEWNGLMKASERGESRVHPTQKPVALAAWCFNEFGKSGDTVMDLFIGSGSTTVACEQTGRINLGMEMSPDYVAVVLERVSALGLTPKLTETAQPSLRRAPAAKSDPLASNEKSVVVPKKKSKNKSRRTQRIEH